MGQLRRIIFLVFVVVYAVVAPFTVLFALGYIFSPAQQTLLQTGLVSLISDPPRASVWLNGVPIKDKTPLVLRNLKAGYYDIGVNLAGYHPWQRQVEVKPDRALRFENILLFPVQYDAEILGDFPVKRMWHVRGGRYVIVLGGETTAGLRLFDLEERRFLSISLSGRYQEALVEEVLPHPNADRALLILKKGRTSHALLIKFTDPLRLKDLTYLVQEPLTSLKWSTAHKDTLFYLKGDLLKRVDLERGVFFSALRKQVKAFALHEGHLYVLETSGRFLELTEKGKVRRILLEDPAKARQILGSMLGNHYSIFFLPHVPLFFQPGNPLAFFLSDQGRLLSNKLPYFLDEGVDQLALAISHPRIAYRKGKELWVVDFEREREDTFFESGPSPRRIYEGKEPLSSFTWGYDDQYVLLQEGNRLKIQDFETEEGKVDLLEISGRVPEFVLDAKRGFLYFVHPDENRLAAIPFPKEGIRLAPPLITEFVDDLMTQRKESK